MNTDEGEQLIELRKLQLQQAIETYRAQLSLLIQIETVILIADARSWDTCHLFRSQL